jgi:hypothetical protein
MSQSEHNLKVFISVLGEAPRKDRSPKLYCIQRRHGKFPVAGMDGDERVIPELISVMLV